MAASGTTDDTIDKVLSQTRTIAVVGASTAPDKPSHSVPASLQKRGFRVLPVHPSAEEIFGEQVHHDLAELRGQVDLVEVFRPAAEAEGIARQAVEIGARALWLQLGIASEAARRVATEAGLDYVEDRCMGVETARRDTRVSAGG